MIKVTHTFNSAAEAQAHLARFSEGSVQANQTRYEAPAAQPAPYTPPQPAYQPPPVAAPAQPVYNSPGPNVPVHPQGNYTHPAPTGGYVPPQGTPVHQPQSAPANAGNITPAQLAQAAQNYAKVHGAKAAKAKFAELGVTKVSDIQPANYGYALQALQA